MSMLCIRSPGLRNKHFSLMFQALVRKRFVILSERKISFLLPKKKQFSPLAYVLLSIPVTTFCFGTWQVKRRAWKLSLIDDLQKRVSAPPIDLPSDMDELNNMEYQKVYLRGRFDHSKEVHIGPRSLIAENAKDTGSLFSSSHQSGNLVVTPFHLEDRDLVILVNRGWIPKTKTLLQHKPEQQANGVVEFVGVVRQTEKRTTFLPQNEPDKGFFYYRDVEQIARKCDAAPLFVDADFQSSVPGGPIGGQTRVTLRNEHLSYIVQFYGISAATSILWYMKYVKNIA